MSIDSKIKNKFGDEKYFLTCIPLELYFCHTHKSEICSSDLKYLNIELIRTLNALVLWT